MFCELHIERGTDTDALCVSHLERYGYRCLCVSRLERYGYRCFVRLTVR